jgi:glycosyltransferase involved in cell wall biosynthesis
MKILQVIHSLDPQAGGTTEAVRQLSTALVRRGVQVDVLTLDAPDAPWLRDFPLPVTALGPGRGNYGYAPRLVPWLVRHGAEVDLVLVNGLWQFGSFAVWLAARKTSLRYAVFPHGMLDPWFRRRYPLKHLKKWCYWPWAEYRVLRDAGAVFFTSEDERLEARRSFWLYRCREQVVGFGIDPPPLGDGSVRETFLRQFPTLAGRRLLLFLGRVHEKKGCDLLLRAFRELLTRAAPAGASGLHLVMAGPTDHPYGAAMLELAGQLGLEKDVTWTGMLRGELKWGAFLATEAFVLPSHQENFGVSVVEALACARPVLISNRVNIWREIEAAQAGLVEPDDAAGTLRLLERWHDLDAGAREKMAAQARACYQLRFRMDQAADRLIEAFQSLGLESPSRPASPG